MIGYIYQLHSAYTDDGVYVGSTIDFDMRKSKHKISCYNENSKKYNYKLYKYIRDYGGWCNWLMLIVEEFEYNDKEELLEREQYWIKELKANLNSKNAYLSNEDKRLYHNKKELEYYYKDKEKYKQKLNKYYQANKEKINEKKNQQFKCECGKMYTRNHKARHIKSKKHQAYLQQLPASSS